MENVECNWYTEQLSEKRFGRGKLIIIEGFDGSGKTTQVNLLKDFLTTIGKDVLVVHLPDYDGVGEFIRNTAFGGEKLKFNYATEAMLFMADLIELSLTKIEPHLEKGGYVICSRWTLSTLGYQTNRLVDRTESRILEVVKIIHTITDSILVSSPDLKIVLTASLDNLLNRVDCRGFKDAMEMQPKDFQNSVRDCYNKYIKPLGYKQVDSERKVESVALEIKQLTLDMMCD